MPSSPSARKKKNAVAAVAALLVKRRQVASDRMRIEADRMRIEADRMRIEADRMSMTAKFMNSDVLPIVALMPAILMALDRGSTDEAEGLKEAVMAILVFAAAGLKNHRVDPCEHSNPDPA